MLEIKNLQVSIKNKQILKGLNLNIKPGELHQFEALEDSVAFELYWAEFDHNDIERDTVGYSANDKQTLME